MSDSSESTQRETLARGAGRVGALTMLSRLLGVVREQVFYATLGANRFTDAYWVAFRIPNLLRDLFAEGALSAAFVPTYVQTLRQGSRERAFALASRVLTTLTVYLGVLAAVVMLFPGPVVRLLGGGFEPEAAEVSASLLRIMMPFLPLISITVVAYGILNAEGRFTAPALAPALFNVVAIVGGAVVYLVEPSALLAVTAWAALTLLGGLAQLLVQVPPLSRLGFRPQALPDLTLRDQGTRRIAILMGPAALGVAAVDFNVIVNTWFASHIEGAVTWLQGAFRLMQLPLGVFGVAVGTAATTQLARDAADGDMEALRGTLRRGLRLVFFLTLPSTVGLALLAEPIIRLIYEHGVFTAASTTATAEALAAYSSGLAAYAGVKVMAPAYYALGRPGVPLAGSLIAVAANFTWNVTMFEQRGHVGLALGTSLAAASNLFVLVAYFQATVGGLVNRELTLAVLRMVLAAAAMGPPVYFLAGALPRYADALVPVAAGAAVYFVLARLMKLAEVDVVVRRFRRGARKA